MFHLIVGLLFIKIMAMPFQHLEFKTLTTIGNGTVMIWMYLIIVMI